MKSLIDRGMLAAPNTRVLALNVKVATQAATPGNTVVTIRMRVSGYFYIDWGDNQTEGFDQLTVEVGTLAFPISHTYATVGVYNIIVYILGLGNASTKTNELLLAAPTPPNLITEVRVRSVARFLDYSSAFNSSPYLTSVDAAENPLGAFSGNMSYMFNRCTALAAVPAITFLPGTNLDHAFSACGSLSNVSALAAVNWANVGSMFNAFNGCSSMSSFPEVNIPLTAASSASDRFYGTWANSGLTSFGGFSTLAKDVLAYTWFNNGAAGFTTFPMISIPNITGLHATWAGCSRLTSFPALNLDKVTELGTQPFPTTGAWQSCSGLTSFPAINFPEVINLRQAWGNCSGLTSFPLISMPKVQNISGAWSGCSGLTSFPAINFITVTNASSDGYLGGPWQSCTGLTSFPAINFPDCTTISGAWAGCSGLTSFPLLSLPKVTSISFAWAGCIGLTSFPAIAFPEVTNGSGAWSSCGFTTFPSISFPKLTDGRFMFENCPNLTTFPAGVFNLSPCTNYYRAFNDSPLTSASVNNILISINNAGTSNGVIEIYSITGSVGPAAPTGAGLTAKAALQSRGWTVTTN